MDEDEEEFGDVVLPAKWTELEGAPYPGDDTDYSDCVVNTDFDLDTGL